MLGLIFNTQVLKTNQLLFTLLVSIFSFSYVQAQKNTVASGGEGSGSGGTVSYSVGQIDYIVQGSSGGNVNQGLQQPYELYTVGVAYVNEKINTELMVYPNPTTSDVILEMEQEHMENLNYFLFDAKGELLLSGKTIDTHTALPTSTFSSATYFLKVSNGTSVIKVFKIIKTK